MEQKQQAVPNYHCGSPVSICRQSVVAFAVEGAMINTNCYKSSAETVQLAVWSQFLGLRRGGLTL